MFFLKMFQSRKFTTMITGLTLALLNDKFGWGVSPETVENVLKFLFGYILTQGGVDIAKGLKGVTKTEDTTVNNGGVIHSIEN